MTRPARPIHVALAAAALCFCAGTVFAADFPPLSVEITPEHPLLIFQVSPDQSGDGGSYGQRVLNAWYNLPPQFRSYAALQLTTPEREQDRRHANYKSLLQLCQDNEVPVVLDIADGDPRRYYPIDQVEELLLTYTCIKGVSATGMRFEVYESFGAGLATEAPPMVRWLISAVDLVARYGRFIWIPLDELRWPRAMSNRDAAPLYAKMRECAAYVIPGNQHRGPHDQGRMSALLGLWLEGAVNNWGIEADPRWYEDANFLSPGQSGANDAALNVPSSILRAMILNGAMAGATVYAFAPDIALWFGSEARHWETAIAPTLAEIIENGFIARKDFVQKKTPVALQLAPAATPEDFHLNLREIDGVWDRGLMIHGAYGMEAPGLIPELIINRSGGFWVPVVSTHAPAEMLQGFSQVVQPGMMPSAAAWREMFERQQGSGGGNQAFVAEVGRAIFVMNTRENLREVQRFVLPEAPAPVRNIQALRQGETVEVTWPFREGDLSYKVLRRIPPSPNYEVLVSGLYDRRFVDEPPPSAPVAYVVTALTNEKEPYEGFVNYGEYRAVSVVESRPAEEVVLSPLLSTATSGPIEQALSEAEDSEDWWMALAGLEGTALPLAQLIAGRLQAWEEAVNAQDLDLVAELYHEDYKDPEGWGKDYVRRAFQWYFERYSATRLLKQVRSWDFSEYETRGVVHVNIWLRFTGVAISDPAGRVADQPIMWPRAGDGEVRLSFSERFGAWRMETTSPAVPNFRDILSYSTGPFDHYELGPDVYSPEVIGTP